MAAPLNVAATADATSAPVRILLVDDQPGRLLTYRAILEPLGEHLVDASSGVEALGRLMEEDYALILLDVNMPGMDGFETASMIHQHPRFENTPIIFVTAVNVTDMDRLRGYKIGAVDYVMVPVIPEILRSKVMVLAELHRKRLELEAANAQLAAANLALHTEKARELALLNESLRNANETLEIQNRVLQEEVAERTRVEQLLRGVGRRKDEFLATLAHELRNPLAPLQNALGVLRISKAVDSELLALMERQLALMVRLIDDLLDIARISQAKLILRRQPTTLREIVESAVETARPVIEQGGHELVLDLPAQPVHLVADQARLSQVFANLLNNAAKYSEACGRIELRVRVHGDRAEVEVIDAGIGLDPSQAERIFEMFSQVETSVDRTHGGLGIGLTLVRRLAELHGGDVSVSSDGIGRGATFTVALPLVTSPGAQVPAAAAPDAFSDEVRRRVLVVDDNRDAADTLAMMVELLGHDVRRLYDPHLVLEEAATFAPEIVFLDVGMPGLSGYELAPQLRSVAGLDDVRIVAVTGWGQPEDRRRTREAGFDEHLVKPPMLDAIQRLCNAPAQACRSEGSHHG